MCYGSILDFPILPQRLIIDFPVPKSDLDLEEFGQRLLSQGGTSSIPLPENPVADPNFLQFDFWLGHGIDWEQQQTKPLSWAYKPEIVQDAPADSQDVKARSIKLHLNETNGVTLICTRPLGRLLNAPRILRPKLSR